MTPTRRSMGEALRTVNLPPEAIDLIREGSPKPRVALEVVEGPGAKEPLAPDQTVAGGETGRDAAPAAPTEAAEPAVRKKREVRASTKAPAEKFAVGAEAAAGLVSVTFRLPGHIPAGLVRASADRKVKRLRPYTQQEIVAQAVGEWLKEQGYLASGAA